MLKITNITASYGLSQVLFGIDLEVGVNQVVTLLGRNGMGKTTTVNTIMGLLRPTAGQIIFDGERLDNLPSFQIARRGIGLVPEGRQVFPNLTVTENLLASAANWRADADPWTLPQIFAMFPELKARKHAMATLLSGGEQQMLAIGRALMTNPRLLILDEATEGLAPMIRQEIWSCLARLKAAGQSILVIDKNIDDLQRIADRHYILQKGQIMWSGDSAALLADEQVKHRYLGL